MGFNGDSFGAASGGTFLSWSFFTRRGGSASLYDGEGAFHPALAVTNDGAVEDKLGANFGIFRNDNVTRLAVVQQLGAEFPLPTLLLVLGEAGIGQRHGLAGGNLNLVR